MDATWTSVPIARIEDLRDAVYGAGLEATQVSTGPLSGNLTFARCDDVLYSSGLINGQVALRGPLSSDQITVGVGLRMGGGTRHWLEETASGAVGVFNAGDEHDAFYTRGSLYATATLSLEQLEQLAAREELVLDRPVLGGTGLHARPLEGSTLTRICHAFELIHAGSRDPMRGTGVAQELLRALISHLGRAPRVGNRAGRTDAHAMIVRRARSYIAEHLAEPIGPDTLARAALTSRRTLFRAFAEILEDTPQIYVMRLRLHRIRHDLASDEERACTVALIANHWGIGELGRMARRYRDLFGEFPSDTLAKQRPRNRPEAGATRLARSA
jgi:AraC-like DNA-binding protein